jgi:dipeptide/tripeptide permease
MRAVLGLFFVERLRMSERRASVAMALFVVACYVTPLFGAYLSDALWGRYTTIVRLSGVYLAGSCLLAAAAAAASPGGVFAALGLVAIGTGGIKPCVSVSARAGSIRVRGCGIDSRSNVQAPFRVSFLRLFF